jgi:CBS domain-containing membrane protein
MKTYEIMSVDLITLYEETNLDLAHTVMKLSRIRHIPVVRGEELVGLITHRGLYGALVAQVLKSAGSHDQKALMSVPVSEIMQKNIPTVKPETDLLEAIDLMLEFKYGCLPVVENGKLVGIVTEADFLKLAKKYLYEQDKGSGKIKDARTDPTTGS